MSWLLALFFPVLLLRRIVQRLYAGAVRYHSSSTSVFNAPVDLHVLMVIIGRVKNALCDCDNNGGRGDGLLRRWRQWATLAILVLLVVRNSRQERPSRHFIVVSSTYYETSAIYAPNTMVVLINGPDQQMFDWNVICGSDSGNSTMLSVTHFQYAYQPVGVCKWTAYIAKCAVHARPDRFFLTYYGLRDRAAPLQQDVDQRAALAEDDRPIIEVPYRRPYRRSGVDVANCFSPFFYNERWQLVLTSLEVYRHFGSGLQVFYVQSMLQSITDVLMEYKREGLVELEPWASFRLDASALHDIGYDPNTELDWRNQASAHTDCFLKYREAAKFIIFGDVDDVFVPRLGARYIDEFRTLSNLFADAAGFTYNRYNTQLRSSVAADRFSIGDTLASAVVADEWEDGKYAVNTSRVETAWIHYPGVYDRIAYRMHTVPEALNFMIHLRNWTVVEESGNGTAMIGGGGVNGKTMGGGKKEDDASDRSPATVSVPAVVPYGTQLRELINDKAVAAIERRFRDFYSARQPLFACLPTVSHYLPLVVACYDRIFYSRGRRPQSCPGPLRCTIPRIQSVRCTVAAQRLFARKLNWHTVFHARSPLTSANNYSDGGEEGTFSDNEQGLSNGFVVSEDGCYLG